MKVLVAPIEFDDYLIHTEPRAGMQRDQVQWIYRLPNGYGASILDGEELAVIKFGDGDSSDVYDWDRASAEETGIETQYGVISVDSDEEIADILQKIKEVEA